MTGPLGPMDDDGVVDLLRAAGHGGREPSPADVSHAMTAGRRIRRRRQTAQVLGSGLAIVAVLGVGITTVGALDSDGRSTPVTTADDPGPVPGPAVGSNAALAAGYLAEDLGDGWLNEDGTVRLDPSSNTANGLPDGGYAATARAEIVSQAAFNQVCGGGPGKQACEEVQTSNDKTIHLWDWADRDLATGEIRGETSAYRPLEKGRYQLIAVSVDGPSIPAAQREAHLGAVGSWFTSMEGPLRKAVTDTRIENSLTVEPNLAAGVLARNANVALLLAALGPDFRINTREEVPGAVLRTGTPSAAGLPEGYDVASEIWVKGPGDGEVGLEELCTPLTEEALVRSACTTVKTSDGRPVQVQTRRWMESGSTTAAYSMLLAFLDRGDGTYVEVRMSAHDRTEGASAQRQAAAASWLEGYREKLAELAADPRVQSGPKRDAGEDVSNLANSEVLVDHLGLPFVVTGTDSVEFAAGSSYDPPLPSDSSAVTGEIGAITQVKFDAVCRKAGATPCAEREAPGDRKVWVWGYADRDVTANEVWAERAVYFVRDDGTIVRTALRLTTPGVGAAGAAAQIAAAKAWLENLEDALISAATDARLKF